MPLLPLSSLIPAISARPNSISICPHYTIPAPYPVSLIVSHRSSFAGNCWLKDKSYFRSRRCDSPQFPCKGELFGYSSLICLSQLYLYFPLTDLPYNFSRYLLTLDTLQISERLLFKFANTYNCPVIYPHGEFCSPSFLPN